MEMADPYSFDPTRTDLKNLHVLPFGKIYAVRKPELTGSENEAESLLKRQKQLSQKEYDAQLDTLRGICPVFGQGSLDNLEIRILDEPLMISQETHSSILKSNPANLTSSTFYHYGINDQIIELKPAESSSQITGQDINPVRILMYIFDCSNKVALIQTNEEREKKESPHFHTSLLGLMDFKKEKFDLPKPKIELEPDLEKMMVSYLKEAVKLVPDPNRNAFRKITQKYFGSLSPLYDEKKQDKTCMLIKEHIRQHIVNEMLKQFCLSEKDEAGEINYEIQRFYVFNGESVQSINLPFLVAVIKANKRWYQIAANCYENQRESGNNNLGSLYVLEQKPNIWTDFIRFMEVSSSIAYIGHTVLYDGLNSKKFRRF